MKASIKPLLLAALLSSAAFATLAQPGSKPAPGAGPCASAPEEGRHARKHERMQEHLSRRATALKDELKLSPQQEAGWESYLAALKPPARPQHTDMAGLSTPQRLDRMGEMRKLREAEFERREAATRAFYSTLNAEQQKVFDARTARHGHHRQRPASRG